MKKYTEPKKRTKLTALFLALLMLVETIIPNVSFALSGGPTQPEVQGFTPAGTTDMVDLFTGDFNYNIPLMDIDGYPINLGYQSGVGMDQEASWVGLGWNLNPGAINRSMRGLPDDFNGEEVEKRVHIKPSYNISLSGSIQAKLFGFQINKATSTTKKYLNGSVGLNLELFYNNYKGVGVNFTPDWDVNFSKQTTEDLPPTMPSPATAQDSSKQKDAVAQANMADKARKTYTASSALQNLFKKMYMSPMGHIPGVGLFSTQTEIQSTDYQRTQVTTKTINLGSLGGQVSLISSYFPSGTGYLPKLSNNMQNYNFNFNMNFGTAVSAVFGAPKVNIAVSWEGTDGETFKKKAYGAYYHNNSLPDDDVLLDFNRDHDGEYTKNKPVLPMPVNMYDIYSISGQGVGGMFRVMSNGINVYHDDRSSSVSNSGGGAFDLGVGTDAHSKLNVSYTNNNVLNAKWSNSFTNKISDNTNATAEANFEPKYFKLSGEKNSVNKGLLYYKKLGVPYKPKIEKVHLFKVDTREALDADNEADEPLQSGLDQNLYSSKRNSRNQFVSALTYNELNAFQEPTLYPGTFLPSPLYDQADATNQGIYSWLDGNSITDGSNNLYSSETTKRRANHVGEITLHQTNGSRYIYGVAAYNNEQTEYTFNIGPVQLPETDGSYTGSSTKPRLNPNTNIVDINNKINGYITSGVGYGAGGGEDSKSDQYFNKTKTPGFAHAYLLSSILQADYVDLAPRGVGAEDLGNYTKFNYIRTTNEYRWRTPAVSGAGTFIEGLKSQSHDNKVSFVEGTKELWYLQTIESKNHVALFVIEPREDASAILHGEITSGLSTTSMQNYTFRLKRIVLYTREEYEKHQNSPLTTATPIKTVWFNYDYTLCPGINNTWTEGGGKLTLTGIYFTYGNSSKKVSTYKFQYPTTTNNNHTGVVNNPYYNQSNIDRWGNYKPDPLTGEPSNINFPYVKQDKAAADKNAAAWLLNGIKLPSGGVINIHYESDDYAYVQNKRAAQMMPIEAVNSNHHFPSSDKNRLYDGSTNNNYLFFKIPSEVYTGALDVEKAKKDYMYQCADGLQDMSFKILIGIRDNGDKEWINGYANVQEIGLAASVPSGVTDDYFYVKVKCLDLESRVGSGSLHPFTKAGFNFAKSNLPFVVNPTSFGDMAQGGADAKEFAFKLLGVADLIEKLWGVNDRLLRDNFCKYITLGQSYCRLNEPFKKKLGGGTRVRKITINDSWSNLTNITGQSNAQSEAFGQEFDYTIEETTQDKTRKISSGVASYEPSFGGEENPFKLPIGYARENFLSPDEDLMVEGPIGESFFPSAGVGYSSVTVTNLGRTKTVGSTQQKVSSHGVGKTISTFYTAKDFPTLVSHTAVSDERVWTPLIDLFIYKTTMQEKYVSQGFSVECNDMHGKPKSVEVYRELADGETFPKLLTGTYYKYRTMSNNPNRLNNEDVSVINDLGVETKETVGVESEMYADTRKQENETNGASVQMAFEVINISFFVVFPFIPVYPDYTHASDGFYSTSLNRVTTKYGILEEVRVIQDGSEITTRNVSFDALSGEVLVTKTTNEFRKDVYSTTYPAHWIYNNMGPGYKNVGIGFSDVSLSSGNITTSAVTAHLCKGDEVLINNTTLAIVDQEGSNFKLYDALMGAAISTTAIVNLKIVRSGRRNMQSMPIFNATSLKKPFSTSGSETKLNLQTSTQIVDAKATTYQLDQSRYVSFTEVAELISGVRYPYDKDEFIAVINYLLPFIHLDLTSTTQFTATGYPNDYVYRYNIPNDIVTGTGVPGPNTYSNSFIAKNITQYLAINPNQNSTGHSLFFRKLNNKLSILFDFESAYNLPTYGITFPLVTTGFTYSGKELNSIEVSSSNLIRSGNQIPENCYHQYNYAGNAIFKNTSSPYTVSSHTIPMPTTNNDYYIISTYGYGDCVPFNITSELVNSNYSQNGNSALHNKRVIIKPQANFLFKEQRNTSSSVEKFANTKGTYADYNAFYNLNNKTIVDFTASNSKWKMSETSTLFDPYNGAEIESKDALNRYRSVVYLKDQFLVNNYQQFNNQQEYGISHKPQLYLENAKQGEATVFNFESKNELRELAKVKSMFDITDKHYFETVTGMNNYSVNLTNQSLPIEKIGHTGNSSLKITQGATTSANFYIAPSSYPSSLNNAIMPFYPQLGKKYLISGWVHGSKPFYDAAAIKALCKVEVMGKDRGTVISSVTCTPSGPVIEGWQRFYAEFTIQNGTVNGVATDAYILRVSLSNDETTSNSIYFDDVRLHPFDANIKNYIYDEQHRVKAMLDENNYATFYMYNNKGELVTVRRETEKGIITIQENRKNNSNLND